MKATAKTSKIIVTALLIICIMSFCISCSSKVKEIDDEIVRMKELDVEFTDMYLIDSLSELINAYESLSEDEKSEIKDQEYMNRLIEIYPEMKKFTIATTRTVNKFISMLKDPSSLIYTKNYISGYCIPEENYYIFKIDYNAKNSFGAYTGNKTIYGIFNDGSVKIFETTNQYYYISQGYNPYSLEKDDLIIEFVVSKPTLEDIQKGEYLLY